MTKKFFALLRKILIFCLIWKETHGKLSPNTIHKIMYVLPYSAYLFNDLPTTYICVYANLLLTILFLLCFVLFIWNTFFSWILFDVSFLFFWSNLSGNGGTKSHDKNAFSLNKPVPGALYWKKATIFIFIWFYFYLTRWRLLRFWKEKKYASLASRRHLRKKISPAIGCAPNRWHNAGEKNSGIWTLYYSILMR